MQYKLSIETINKKSAEMSIKNHLKKLNKTKTKAMQSECSIDTNGVYVYVASKTHKEAKQLSETLVDLVAKIDECKPYCVKYELVREYVASTTGRSDYHVNREIAIFKTAKPKSSILGRIWNWLKELCK